MTTYILLRRVVDTVDATWDEVGRQQASGPRAALRQHHEQHPISGDAVYAAVPVRNWSDLTPELVTETRLVFR